VMPGASIGSHSLGSGTKASPSAAFSFFYTS
jgi:hypothetical protein